MSTDEMYYNINNLKPEDKEKIRSFNMALDSIDCKEVIAEEMLEFCPSKKLKEILTEVIAATVDACMERIEHVKYMRIITIMDGYSEEFWKALEKEIKNDM